MSIAESDQESGAMKMCMKLTRLAAFGFGCCSPSVFCGGRSEEGASGDPHSIRRAAKPRHPTKDGKDVSPSLFRCRYSDRYNSGSKSYHFCSLLAVDDPHGATRHRYLAVAVSDGREIYLVDNAILRQTAYVESMEEGRG
jgi:hypothetical protein